MGALLNSQLYALERGSPIELGARLEDIASPREPAISTCSVMVLQIHVSVGDSTWVLRFVHQTLLPTGHLLSPIYR